jgi:hypothetical protein
MTMEKTTAIPCQPVKSTSVQGIGYDATSQTLAVQFRGATYHYAGVPVEVYEEFKLTESFGRFFQDRIRGKFGEPVKIPAAAKEEASAA